jgi:hypothetical protein
MRFGPAPGLEGRQVSRWHCAFERVAAAGRAAESHESAVGP